MLKSPSNSRACLETHKSFIDHSNWTLEGRWNLLQPTTTQVYLPGRYIFCDIRSSGNKHVDIEGAFDLRHFTSPKMLIITTSSNVGPRRTQPVDFRERSRKDVINVNSRRVFRHIQGDVFWERHKSVFRWPSMQSGSWTGCTCTDEKKNPCEQRIQALRQMWFTQFGFVYITRW